MSKAAVEDTQIQRVLEFSHHIPGQTWPNELGWLLHVMHPFSVHAEIGVFCGRSLYATAGGMHLLGKEQHTIFAVEPTGFTGDHKWDSSVLASTISKIHRDFPSVHIEHLQQLSVDAFRAAAGHQVDSVFIDAVHEYAEVCADIECWGRAARHLASGHDYWPRHPGVMDAVQEHVKEAQVVSGTRIWFIDKRKSKRKSK